MKKQDLAAQVAAEVAASMTAFAVNAGIGLGFGISCPNIHHAVQQLNRKAAQDETVREVKYLTDITRRPHVGIILIIGPEGYPDQRYTLPELTQLWRQASSVRIEPEISRRHAVKRVQATWATA